MKVGILKFFANNQLLSHYIFTSTVKTDRTLTLSWLNHPYPIPPPFLSRITYYQGRSHDFLNSIKLKSLPIQEVTWRHCRNPSRDRGISAVSNLNSIVVVNISQFKCIGGVTCGLQSQFRCFNIKINSTPQGDYTVYCIQWPFHSW